MEHTPSESTLCLSNRGEEYGRHNRLKTLSLMFSSNADDASIEGARERIDMGSEKEAPVLKRHEETYFVVHFASQRKRRSQEGNGESFSCRDQLWDCITIALFRRD